MIHHVWHLHERVEGNLGLACTVDGLFLGRTPLIERRDGRFDVRGPEEIQRLIDRAYRTHDSAARLMSGLATVARALNANDRCLAHIAAVHLRLPDLPSGAAVDALEAEDILVNSKYSGHLPPSGPARKASPDDPDHPGWPAGTPGGLGGKFRPKNELAASVSRKALRKSLRMGAGALLRMTLEGAEGAVPIIGFLGDVALIADLARTTKEFYDLKIAADAAIAFAQHGPYSFKELQAVSATGYEEFPNYDAFYKDLASGDLLEKRFGPAGIGYQYHHIVEQRSTNNIPATLLQNTDNIIRLPTLIHEAVTAEYNKIDPDKNMTKREWLSKQPYAVQQEEGLKILRDLGVLK